MAEKWRPVVGFKDRYSVSNRGQVASALTGRILKLRKSDRGGHVSVRLYANGPHDCPVHRLVLAAFAGACPEGQECRHLDGNPKNNRAENLAWGSHVENIRDRDRHGRTARGERNGFARLSRRAVRLIRILYKHAGLSQREIGLAFGVSQVSVSDIVRRKRWAHV